MAPILGIVVFSRFMSCFEKKMYFCRNSLLILGDKKGMAVVKTEIFQDKIDEVLGGD